MIVTMMMQSSLLFLLLETKWFVHSCLICWTLLLPFNCLTSIGGGEGG